MSDAPVCRIHSQPMKVSKFGGWYCTAQMEDETYCKEKVRAPKPSPNLTTASQLASAPNHDVLAAACLSFAGNLFRGSGPEMYGDAINIAKMAYKEMRGVQ